MNKTNTKSSPSPIANIIDLSEYYDAFLLDLWGVVHDGQALYPNVREVILDLRKLGKKIIFLSNAPRRAVKAAAVLANFGISEDMYDHVITSGEAMVGWLDKSEKAKEIGSNYFFIGPDRDLDILDGMSDYKRAGLMQAEWLLSVGYQYDFQPIDELENTLTTAKSMGKPMICVNPDIEVVRQNGERIGCAGEIATAYENMGGEVRYFGKPYADVYDLCISRLGNIAKNHILAVGDSLHTDILGANKVGIDSVLVTGGILKNKLHGENGNSKLDWNALDEQIALNSGATPNYVMAGFGAK